jgi:hypothetical protein
MQKIFLTRDHKATLVCPECERSRTVDVAEHVNRHHEVRIRVKCPCGRRYPATLERRRFFRKDVHFRGTFARLDDGRSAGGGEMAVRDLSRTGVCIRLNTMRKLHVGDRLVVNFCLDDRHRSLIRKESIVRRIDGLDLGAEFTSTDPSDPHAKAIGFYLFGASPAAPLSLAA